MNTLASQFLPVEVSPLKDRTLDTAVLLQGALSVPQHGTGWNSQGRSDDPVGPSTMVGGVPLFLRTILTLQRADIAHVVVLCGSSENALKSLASDSRVAVSIHWPSSHPFPLHDSSIWKGIEDEEGLCLVIGEPVVFSKALIDDLRRQARTAQGRILWPISDDIAQATVADLAVMPRSVFKADRTQAVRSSDRDWFERIRSQAMTGGRVQTFALSAQSPGWVQPVRTSEEIRQAEQRLLATLTSSLDGLVDTYFNRRVASGLTRLFLNFGWSPNAVTVLSLAIGLVAAGWFAGGTYWSGVIGALLFQCSAVVDCCDGDVARLTFRESRFGERLDLVGDNVVHMAIFGAIGWAGYLNGGGWLSLLLGLLAMTGNACSLWAVTRLKTVAEKPATPRAPAPRRDFVLKHVANRDFSLLLLLCSLFDLLAVFLWFAAIGSHIFWMVTAWFTRPSIRA